MNLINIYGMYLPVSVNISEKKIILDPDVA